MMKTRDFGANEDLPLGGQHSSAKDPNWVLDRSENMDRDIENDPNWQTERERKDGLRPEDLENEREKERDNETGNS